MGNVHFLRLGQPRGPRILDLRVELQVHDEQRPPEVRAWVDLEPEGGLASETEVFLNRSATGIWRGWFALPNSCRSYFLYRVGLSANAGTAWSLWVRDRVSGLDVLNDGDTLETPKCWLVGSCSVSPAMRPGCCEVGSAARRGGACPSAARESSRGGADVIVLARRRSDV